MQPSCTSFDAILSDQESLIGYALRTRHRLVGIYIAPGRIRQVLSEWGFDSLDDFIDPDVDSLFVFNDSHVWVVKRIGKQWFEIDSCKGVRHLGAAACGPTNGPRTPVVGSQCFDLNRCGVYVVWSCHWCKMMLPVYSARLAVRMKEVDEETDPTDILSVIDMISRQWVKRCYITNFEVQVSFFFKLYLHVHASDRWTEMFHDFFVKFQRDPGNRALVEEYFPFLLHFVANQHQQKLRWEME